MRFVRPAILLAGAALAFSARPAVAEDKPPAPPAAPAAPASATPGCRALTDKEKGELVSVFKAYLDIGADFATRMNLVLKLKALRESGCDPLGEVSTLSKILYAARPFEPPFDRKTVDKLTDFSVDQATGITNHMGDPLRFSFQLPLKYPKEAKVLNAGAPFPMIVTLHDLEDFQDKATKKYPGAEVIRRRYPRATNKAIHEDFILFAPVATRAKFSTDGAVDATKVPVHVMWQRYHVDFDRVVLDGGSEALLFAASHNVFYAGVIVRGDAADVDPAIVKNFAHMKVFIVGTDASAAKKSLLAGKMPAANVTVGKEDGIHAWVKGLERTTPTSFDWAVKDRSAHRFAHWVNINEIDASLKDITLKVDVLDTKDDPNTIKIASTGIRGLSVFLSDRVLSLDKPVRIVVNGRPLADARLMTGKPEGKSVKLPAKLDRNADVAFDASPELSPRRSRYYGFIYPAVLDFPVKNDAETEEPKKEGASAAPAGAASPQAEADALQYFNKALEKEQAGDLEKAKSLLERAIAVGETSIKPKAEAKLKELQAK
jgi:hypothetical protein